MLPWQAVFPRSHGNRSNALQLGLLLSLFLNTAPAYAGEHSSSPLPGGSPRQDPGAAFEEQGNAVRPRRERSPCAMGAMSNQGNGWSPIHGSAGEPRPHAPRRL